MLYMIKYTNDIWVVCFVTLVKYQTPTISSKPNKMSTYPQHDHCLQSAVYTPWLQQVQERSSNS